MGIDLRLLLSLQEVGCPWSGTIDRRVDHFVMKYESYFPFLLFIEYSNTVTGSGDLDRSTHIHQNMYTNVVAFRWKLYIVPVPFVSERNKLELFKIEGVKITKGMLL